MKNNSLVSIILPAYNAQPYIERCLDTVINQSYKNIEIIIVDDGSTDNTLSLIRKYKERDDRVILITQENQGVSTARNEAIKKARGKYICYLDADDRYTNDYVETLVSEIEESDYDMVVCGYYYALRGGGYEDKVIKHSFGMNNSTAMEFVFNSNSFGPFLWNKIFVRKIINQNDIRFDSTLKRAQDQLWVIEYLLQCKKVRYINKMLYYYEFSKSSVTRQTKIGKEFDNKFYCVLDAHKKVSKLIRNESLGVKKNFQGRMVCTYLHMLLNLYYCKDYDKEKLFEIKLNIRRRLGAFVGNKAFSVVLRGSAILIAISPKMYLAMLSVIDTIHPIDKIPI